MKYFSVTLILLISVHSIGLSQCNIPGGDFEDFQDFPPEMNEGYYNICNDTITASPYFTPLLRVLTLTFELIFSGYDDITCQQLYGLQQYNEGVNETSSALKLQPDTLLNFADAFTAFPCDTLPIALKGNILHSGNELDSIEISVGFGADLDGDPSATGFLTIKGGSEEYTEFEVPINVIDSEIGIDTAIVFFSAYSDSVYLSEGNESYYVIDELQFVYEEAVSTYEIQKARHLTISPNPAVDVIKIDLVKDYKITQVKIYDEAGATVIDENHIFKFSTNININHLPPGLYVVDVIASDFRFTKKLIKL